MGESEASGEARVDDPVDVPIDGRTFDAFTPTTWNFKTWNFHPAPMPWYRSGQSIAAMTAVSIAVIALVVSVVLLAIRGVSESRDTPATATSTAPTTATTAPLTSLAVAPPLPPPPPPPTASEVKRAPVIVRSSPKPTKKPEFNVTRTPTSANTQRPNSRP